MSILGSNFIDEEDLADWLEKNRPKWRGGFSEVYDLGDSVLKVTEDECYLKFLEFVDKNKNDKHLPVIIDRLEISGCHYILIEKLYPSLLWISEDASNQGWYCYDTDLWKGLSESFDKTLDKLKDFFDDEVSNHTILHMDIRDSNVMVRQDDTLVITDPFSESEYW